MTSGERDRTGSGTPSARSLARILRALKRRGSNLLVVGLTSDEERGRVCRRMLGDDTAGPRRRLILVTGADTADVVERAGRTQRPSTATSYITYSASARSASRTSCSGSGNDGGGGIGEDDGGRNDEEIGEDDEDESEGNGKTLPGGRHVENGRLSDLAAAIEEEIDTIEAANDGFVPAELRVCIDSLTPLLDAHDREAVKRFLERVTARVKKANGMGHVHLPVSRDWNAVADIEEVFEAVVELRVEQGRVKQRWHLRDAGVTSEWFGL